MTASLRGEAITSRTDADVGRLAPVSKAVTTAATPRHATSVPTDRIVAENRRIVPPRGSRLRRLETVRPSPTNSKPNRDINPAEHLETLRAYVAGLGGQLNIVAHIGNIHLNIA
jgi:hypothetical protein